VDPAPYLSILEERFGMDPGWFTERYRFFTGGRKYLYSLSAGHRIPPGPEIAFSGIKFMRISMKVPKLTTEAAVAFGGLAVRNHVDLDGADAARYFARRDLPLDDGIGAACTGPGYVLVRVRGLTVGTGYLRQTEDGGRNDGAGAAGTDYEDAKLYTLTSWCPRHWSEVITIR
jgi:NOL1/NOP2/fmu family ribosome biogenesis protein